jgi:non-specific serine/threonine protein kinase
MLETIREFALEQLEQTAELAAARRAHACWCLAFAEAAHPQRSLPELPDQRLADWLASEYDNLRAALAWFIEAGQADAALRLASILGSLWFVRGSLTEGIQWFERARALPGSVPAAVTAGALLWHGALGVFRGDGDGPLKQLARSQAIFRDLDDQLGLAATDTLLAAQADYAGDQSRATELHERALAGFRTANDANGIAQALANLSDIAYQQGDLQRAHACSREAVIWLARLANDWTAAFVLSHHAHVLLRRGENAEAARLADEALRRAEAAASPLAVANVLVGVAHLYATRGEWARAATVLGTVDAACTRYGIWTLLHHSQQRQVTEDVRAGLQPQAFARAWTAGQNQALELAVADAHDSLAAEPAPTPPPAGPAGLTQRELEVLRLIAAGHSDRAIAAALFISTRTVTTHVTHILTKLGSASRTEAAAWAVRHGVA